MATGLVPVGRALHLKSAQTPKQSRSVTRRPVRALRPAHRALLKINHDARRVRRLRRTMDAANSPATPQTDETPSPESGETSSPVASADRQATRSLDIDVTVCTDLVVRLRDHIHSAWDKVGSEERRLNDARSLRGMIAVGQTTGDYTVRQIPSGFNRFMSVKDRLDLLNEVNMFLVDRVLDRLRDRIGALKQSTATPALRSVANGIVDRMDTWKSLPDASKAAILTLLDTEQFWADVTEHAAATYDRQNGRGATATKKQQGNANKRARASAVSLADEPESSKVGSRPSFGISFVSDLERRP